VEVLPLLALIVIALAGERLLRARRLKNARQRLEQTARELGLRVEKGSRLVGGLGGSRVETGPLGGGGSTTLTVAIENGGDAALPSGLELRVLSVAARFNGPDNVRTGDEPFDNVMLVRGKEDEVLSVLDEPTRRILDEDLTDVLVEDGRLSLPIRLDGLGGHVRLALDLAQRLSRPPTEAASRLARNAREDPVAEVRLRNLKALLACHPGAPVISETLRAALDDVSPEIRLCAARALRAEPGGALGRDARQALLELLGPGEPDQDAALGALAELLKGASADECWEAIDAALLQRSRWVRERALSQALEIGGGGLPERLLRLLGDLDPETAIAAARALAEHGDASCESALVRTLAADDLGVREAAADALGAVGTTAAVMPLRQIAGDPGVRLLAPALRRAAARAIKRIQSRSPEAAAGQVSLAGERDTSGRLSLSDASSQGALTLDGDATRRPPRRRRSRKKREST